MPPSRPRILFGEHRTQAPAIELYVDHARFDVHFASFEKADFAAWDLVIPLRVDQIAPARAANLDGRRRAVLPAPDVVALCDDKLLFNQRLCALGFADLIPALLPDPPGTYPYIRKARHGDFGIGCRMVRAPGEDAIPIPDSFCQRAVEGPYEFVLHLLRIGGRIRFATAYRYDMGEPLAVRGGAGSARTIEPTDAVDAVAPCAAILDAIGFEGTCCFNYKYDGDRPQILELNPRFGGSLVGEVTAYLAAHLDAFGIAG